jgi:hypothetical protein
MVMMQYHKITSNIPIQPEDRALLNPFLAKYNWLSVVEGVPPTSISDWISLPSSEEHDLQGLVKAVHDYYGKIVPEMRKLDIHTTTLRWIHSTKE